MQLIFGGTGALAFCEQTLAVALRGRLSPMGSGSAGICVFCGGTRHGHRKGACAELQGYGFKRYFVPFAGIGGTLAPITEVARIP